MSSLKLDINKNWTSKDLSKAVKHEGLTFQDRNDQLNGIIVKCINGFGSELKPSTDGIIEIKYDKKNKVTAFKYRDTKIDDRIKPSKPLKKLFNIEE